MMSWTQGLRSPQRVPIHAAERKRPCQRKRVSTSASRPRQLASCHLRQQIRNTFLLAMAWKRWKETLRVSIPASNFGLWQLFAADAPSICEASRIASKQEQRAAARLLGMILRAPVSKARGAAVRKWQLAVVGMGEASTPCPRREASGEEPGLTAALSAMRASVKKVGRGSKTPVTSLAGQVEAAQRGECGSWGSTTTPDGAEASCVQLLPANGGDVAAQLARQLAKVLQSAAARQRASAWERWRTLPVIVRALSRERQRLEDEWRSWVGEDRALSAELAAAAEIAVEHARFRALATLAATTTGASRSALRRQLYRWHRQARQESFELKASRTWRHRRLLSCWTSWKAWLKTPPFRASQLCGACFVERSIGKLVQKQVLRALQQLATCLRPSQVSKKCTAWPQTGELRMLEGDGVDDEAALADRADRLMRLKVRLAWHADFAHRCFGAVASKLPQAPHSRHKDSLVSLKQRLDRGAGCLMEYTLASLFRGHLRWALNSLLSAAATSAVQKPRHRLLPAAAPALIWA
ncbi:unnamed protein product [Symbiodinium necroappetens]|uniref:Uncharacterized protein n=1 Tax=Symbiodinium necroappetens TaxID=1628268 RepID=A0A812LU07_9DINO|nr:unnamed protein product [Symbiodinium necroappetens]